MNAWKSAALAVCTAAMILSGPANAACGASSCGPTLITKLYVNATNQAFVQVAENLSPLNCTPEGGALFTLDLTQPSAEELYALLLSAHLQRTPLLIRLDDNSPGCTIAYAVSEQ